MSVCDICLAHLLRSICLVRGRALNPGPGEPTSRTRIRSSLFLSSFIHRPALLVSAYPRKPLSPNMVPSLVLLVSATLLGHVYAQTNLITNVRWPAAFWTS